MYISTYSYKLVSFITGQYEPDIVAYNEGRVGGEQETTNEGLVVSPWTVSSFRHHWSVPPFLPEAQMGSDHIFGVSAKRSLKVQMIVFLYTQILEYYYEQLFESFGLLFQFFRWKIRIIQQFSIRCWLFFGTLDVCRVMSLAYLREGYMVGLWILNDSFGSLLVSFPYTCMSQPIWLFLTIGRIFIWEKWCTLPPSPTNGQAAYKIGQ